MSFTYVLSTLRHRWLIMLIALLLGGLGGAAYLEVTPDRYEATTSLVVSPVVSNPLTGSRDDVNIRTEQEILGSREVARRAVSALGNDGTGEVLRGEVSVAAPMGSQILQVTVRSDSPEEAAEGADAIAAAYLELRKEAAGNVTERYLRERRPADRGSARPAVLPHHRGPHRAAPAAAHERHPVGPGAGPAIGAAVPPTEPSGPGELITIAGATMAGLLLGIAAAVMRERVDPLVRSADRLELTARPDAVVTSKHSDDQFWVGLADEAVRRSGVDPAHDPVRVLLHTVPPMPSRVAADRLLTAVRGILDDPGTALAWGEEARARTKTSEDSCGCAVIVPSGSYRTSIVGAARRSDVAVLAATPRTSLKDLTDLVTVLRETGLEVVVGLSDAPLPAPSTEESEQKDSFPQRRHAAAMDERRADPALVLG